MSAGEIYASLIKKRAPDFDEFDAHICAAVLALGFSEVRTERAGIVDAVGLDGSALARLAERVFPRVRGLFERERGKRPLRGEDEETLLDLLTRCRTTETVFSATLAAMVARRAQRPNHLWQDLGLRHRGELSRLMLRHFSPLARRNSKDMKWKKFLYRTICRDTGYTICAAPSCGECADFEFCFGDEAGESLLARIRRDSEKGGEALRSKPHL